MWLIKKLILLIFLIVSPLAKADISAFQVVRMSYSSTNVTTSAWVQLSPAITGAVRALSIFDSSGQILVLGIGASGNEVAQKWYIFPGGQDMVPAYWPINARLSIKAISGTASSGEIDINLYQ